MSETLYDEIRNFPSVESYLKLYQHLKDQGKLFSAQKALETAISDLATEVTAPYEDVHWPTISETLGFVDNCKPNKFKTSAALFPIYCCLSDICLLQRNTLESLNALIASYKSFDPSILLYQDMYTNLTLAGLIEVFTVVMNQMLVSKEYNKMHQIKDKIILIITEMPTGIQTKYRMAVGKFYFTVFSYTSDRDFYNVASQWLWDIDSLEIKAVLQFYTDPAKAREILKHLICTNPNDSQLWTWLGIMEETYERKFNALKRALKIDSKNWGAWIALGIIQASFSDYVAAAKTWKLTHIFEHMNSKLWLLKAFLYHQASNTEECKSSLKIACDLDPGLYLTK